MQPSDSSGGFLFGVVVMAKIKDRRRELFCLEYIQDFNGTKAAIRAGYSPKTAGSIANEILKKPDILARVRELIQQRCDELCLDGNNVVLRLIDVYERCMSAQPVMVYSFKEKKMVETGEYSFDSKGALKAAELLGKHLGMFTDKLDVAMTVDVSEAISAARKRAQDAR
jgi:phage terminase small subunit